MKHVKLIKFIFFLLLFTVLFTCSKNPAKYQMPNDPRAYTWTVDTLLFYQHNIGWATTLNRLWGSSPRDVYAVGHCTDLWGEIYHFNGEKWNVLKEIRSVDKYYDELVNIFGFSKNDVWIVGNIDYGIGNNRRMGNSIIHFDGTGWYKVFNSSLDTTYRELTSIWGSSPDDIWFGGCWGDMYHWDGQTVTQDTMPFDVKDYMAENRLIASIHHIAGFKDKGLYAVFTGVRVKDDIERDYLMQHTNKGWVFRDSLNSYIDIWMSPTGRLYVANFYGVYEWNGSSLTPLFTDICAWAVYGTDDNHIFAVGRESWTGNGGVAYFNGNTWHILKECSLPEITYTDIWTDGEEVFVTGIPEHYVSTVILHGKMEY